MKKFQLLLALCAALYTCNFVSPKVAKMAFHATYFSLNDWQATIPPDEREYGWNHEVYQWSYLLVEGLYIGVKYGIPIIVGLALGFNLIRKPKEQHAQ